MKKFMKILMIIITILATIIAVKAIADYCCKKYRKTYIQA